jgi:hypothetical protein
MSVPIHEASPDTLSGSFTPDLIFSKLWLLNQVALIQKKFNTIYILGSWYGNLSILMLRQSKIDFKKIANVELNCQKLEAGKRLADKLGIGKHIIAMCKDANSLKYSMIEQPGLVINTSAGNMQNAGWFQNIPNGTLVAIQGRNNDPGSVYEFDSVKELSSLFPVSKKLYSGHLPLKDPETTYTRFMIIGIK